MTLDLSLPVVLNVLTIIGFVVGWIMMASAARRRSNENAARYAKLELKTDTMWDLLIKEAVVEARRQGVLVKQSSEKLNVDIAAQFGDLGISLREFYNKHRLFEVTENELILILAQQFANELIEKVAVPLNLNLRQVLVAAAHLVKEKADN
jgi:hypothetical protein